MSLLDSFNQNIIQDYVDKICKNSLAGLNLVKSLLDEEGKIKFSREVPDTYASLFVMLEFAYLYLHMTYRMACVYLDMEPINLLMKELEVRCISAIIDYALFGLPVNAKSKLKKQAFDGFHVRWNEYCKYVKAFPQKDEGAKDTLFWEFGKIIAELAGLEKKLACNHACNTLAVKVLEDLETKSFIKNVKK